MRDPKLVAASAIALAVTLFAIFWMRPLARKIGLVDRPSARKHHRGSVPLIGGLCFFLGTLVGLSYLGYFDGFVTSLLVAGSLIVVAGALDDANDLSVTSRLLIEAGAAGLVIFMSGFYVHDLGEIIGTRHIDIGLIGIPFTIIAVIGLINAFNMMDGIDGLAASMAMVCIAAMLLFDESPWSSPGVMLMLQVLFAALIPYLLVNLGWPDGRKVFMGDAGSTLIGFVLAWALIYMSHARVGRMAPPDVLWCVALPVMDTLAVMYRRMRLGRSPFRADRQHLHHLLLDTGMPSRLALVIMILAAGALVMLGYGLRNMPQSVGLAAFVLVLALHVWWVPKLLMRLHGRWPTKVPRPPLAVHTAPSTHSHEISFLAGLARFDDRDEADDTIEAVPARAGIALPLPTITSIAEREASGGEAPAPVRALCVLSDPPDAVQLAPLAQQLSRDDRFQTTVCVAGGSEHDTPQVLRLFDLSADVAIDVPSTSEDPAQITSSALGDMKRVMNEVQPDLVLVPGDAPASLAAALAAHYQQVPVVCVDGGLSPPTSSASGEDPGRRLARALASLHVASSQSAGRQLVAEGVPAERVLVSGASAPDTLNAVLDRMTPESEVGLELAQRYAPLRDGHPVLLVLAHATDEFRAALLERAMRRIALHRPDVDVVCTGCRTFDADRGNAASDNLHYIDPPDYLGALHLLRRADVAFVGRELHAEALALDVELLAFEPLQAPADAQARVHFIGKDAEAIAEHARRLLNDVAARTAESGGVADGNHQTMGDAQVRIADALAGLRPAAHASLTLSRDAGSPNHVGMDRAWEAT